jgi:hypothetical protein
LAIQTRARENQRAHHQLLRPVTARVHRQQAHQNLSHAKMVAEVVRISARQLLTTAAHASLALQRVRQLHVGKTAHRALSIVTTRTQVTRASLVQPVLSAAQPLLGTRVATGVQHLLLAAATFNAMTVILVIHVTRTSLAQPVLSAAQPLLGARVTVAHHVVSKTDQQELSIVTHAHRAIRVTVAHLVVSKIVRLAPSTAIHVRHVMTAHRALSIVTHAHRAIRVMVAVVSKTDQFAPLTVTHDQRATVTHAQQELLTAQNHADLASSMTALASSTATTATTAPTVVQTVLTA